MYYKYYPSVTEGGQYPRFRVEDLGRRYPFVMVPIAPYNHSVIRH